jgi:hypothetical protein
MTKKSTLSPVSSNWLDAVLLKLQQFYPSSYINRISCCCIWFNLGGNACSIITMEAGGLNLVSGIPILIINIITIYALIFRIGNNRICFQ